MWQDVSPLPIVAPLSTVNWCDVAAEEFPNVFSSCAVTRSKTKTACNSIQGEFDQTPLRNSCNYAVPGLSLLPASFFRTELIAAQQEDPTLAIII